MPAVVNHNEPLLGHTAHPFARTLTCLVLLGSILGWLLPTPIYAQRVGTFDPVVRAVLFYSPTCPHCHEVIQNILPPLTEQYGDRLEIIGVDVTQEWGQALYQAAILQFAISPERRGVPALIVGSRVLVGSGEIPDFFPNLIEQHLATGGVDWPAIPQLQQMLAAQSAQEQAAPARASASEDVAATQVAPTQEMASTGAASQASLAVEDVQSLATAEPLSWRDRFLQDPVGNGLALVVLIGMVAGLAAVLRSLSQGRGRLGAVSTRDDWLIPLLGVAGLGVAGYLAYIETGLALAVCGPVGDCNAVQQSEYARLFGIPIALYGLAGYAAILALWAIQHWVKKTPLTQQAATGIFVIAMAGVLFSVYLTFLEPFVIGATCMWCLSSALIMTAILLLSTGPGRTPLRV